MKPCDKKALRKAVRQAFPGEAERARQSESICCHVLAWEGYRAAKVIGGYMPMRHEADITAVLRDALNSGKILALPRCGKPPQMTFHRVECLADLTAGAYGLMEPGGDAPVILPGEIDLLLVPLEAVDSRGVRLGKGGGYYDCLLRQGKISTLGVAMAHQIVDELPEDEWDQPLQAVATAQGVVSF